MGRVVATDIRAIVEVQLVHVCVCGGGGGGGGEGGSGFACVRACVR